MQDKVEISVSVLSLLEKCISRRDFLKKCFYGISGGMTILSIKFSDVYALDTDLYPSSTCCYTNCYDDCHDDGCNIHVDGW